MKLSARDMKGFLAAPQKSGHAVLIYGPDHGLVQHRADAVLKAILEDPEDPFNRVDLHQDQLDDDICRLHDEVSAMSFTGGVRLIRVKEAKDKIAKDIEELLPVLEAAQGQTYLLVCAGDLPARSALRKLFEGQGSCVALPCYKEEGAALSQFISRTLHGYGMQVDGEALNYLADQLQGDHQLIVNELEKLSLYYMDQETISLEEIQDVIGAGQSRAVDDLCDAVMRGQTARACTLYDQLLLEGQSAIAILRSMLRYLSRLYQVRAKMADGGSLDEAMRSLRPPVFFKQKQSFTAQARHWSETALLKAMKRLNEAELAFKRSHPLPDTEIERALLFVTRHAARR